MTIESWSYTTKEITIEVLNDEEAISIDTSVIAVPHILWSIVSTNFS